MQDDWLFSEKCPSTKIGYLVKTTSSAMDFIPHIQHICFFDGRLNLYHARQRDRKPMDFKKYITLPVQGSQHSGGLFCAWLTMMSRAVEPDGRSDTDNVGQ